MNSTINNKELHLQSSASMLTRVSRVLTERNLIIFDAKVIFTLMTCFLLFCASVSLRLSGSSSKIWHTYITGDSAAQFQLGTSKWIRFDEWCLQTPFTINQYKNGMQKSNPSIGAANAPMLMSVPVLAFPSILRPQFVAYYFLDFEHSFSFYWNYKSYGLFVSCFLLLLLITRNNFLLSIGGSLWLFFSSYIQWWYSTQIPETLMAAFVICISIIYILYSSTPWKIAISGLALYVYSIAFGLMFYPPYQIPLAYFIVCILLGFIVNNKMTAFRSSYVSLRYATLATTIVLLAVSVIIFYGQTRDTIAIMANTVYPGNRISQGGTEQFALMFTGYFDFLFKELSFPKNWSNVCESSSFMMLFPFVLIGIVVDVVRKRKVDPMNILILGLLTLLCTWVFIGFPPLVAKLTLMNRVRENRALLTIGVANIFLVINYLARGFDPEVVATPEAEPQKQAKSSPKRKQQKNAVTRNRLLYMITPLGIVRLFLCLLIAYISCSFVNSFFTDYFSTRVVMFVSVGLGIVGWAIVERTGILFIAVVVSVNLFSNFLVNPISQGLDPIFNKELMSRISAIRDKDPDAKWLVYGSNILANYAIATGVNCIDGTKFTPDLATIRKFDIDSKRERVYNRFAHVHVVPFQRGTSVDSVEFVLDGDDAYTIFAPPRTAALRDIGVKYFLTNRIFSKEDLEEFEPLTELPINGLYLYERVEVKKPKNQGPLDTLSRLASQRGFLVENLKSTPSQTHDRFLVTGTVSSPAGESFPSSVYAVVNGKAIRGNLESKSSTQQYSDWLRFQIEVPYTRLGTGQSVFYVHIVTSDGRSFWQCPIPIGVNLE